MQNFSSRIVGIVQIDDCVAHDWFETENGCGLSARFRLNRRTVPIGSPETHESCRFADTSRMYRELDRLYRDLKTR